MKLRAEVLGPEHPDTLRAMQHLAKILGDQSKYSQSAELLRGALETSSRVNGPDSFEEDLCLQRYLLKLRSSVRHRMRLFTRCCKSFSLF